MVKINGLTFSEDPLELFLTAPKKSGGSGIIVDARGYILTNAHVAKDVTVLTVDIPGEPKPVQAKVVSSLHDADLALLKIETTQTLQPIDVGSSEDLELGEDVVAIGFPMGLGKTVSKGILSSFVKDLEIGPDRTMPSLLQTDAAINPGNSGGALINMNGQMIGVVVAMLGRAQNISFILPADEVRKHLAELIRMGSPSQPKTGFVAKAHKSGNGRVLFVDSLDSSVDGQGLMYGDHILRVNGTPVKDEADIEFSLLGAKPGENITVEVDRGGMSTSIQLVARP